jgi:succinate dehydrogenase iron-sulfur subunit
MSMKVALKIWRYDPVAGERALKEYELDAPEEATLLDCLDIVKDRIDGTLAYRKSCRMMICGSCGMRMAAPPSSPARRGWTASPSPATCR